MPKFQCVAKKSPTETVEQVLDAESREEALERLSALGYTPIRVTQIKDETKYDANAVVVDRKIPVKHLTLFTRQFSSLFRSHIPIVKSLRILKDQISYAPLQRMIETMSDRVQNQGQTLSDAMESFPKAFAPDYINLVKAGEVGGVLDQVFERLSEKAEKEEALRSKLQAALIYPLFVGGMGVVTVVVLITFVMPKILKVIKSFGNELPLPTRILIALTELFSNPVFWIFFVGAAAALFVVGRILQQRYQLAFDRQLLKVPVLGLLCKQVELVRFCRSLGLLLHHGIFILQALESSIVLVGNTYIRSELELIPKRVREGRSVTDGLNETTFADAYLLNTAAIGEEGGKLSEAFSEAANYYEKDAERTVGILATMLEPIMILMVGAFVGFIVMAVLIPIFTMSTLS